MDEREAWLITNQGGLVVSLLLVHNSISMWLRVAF